MNNKIQEIRQRHEAATPGPWIEYEKDHVKQQDGCYRSINAGKGYCVDGEGGFGIDACITPQDARFIANAPADIAYLLSEYERLTLELNVQKELTKQLQSDNANNEMNLGLMDRMLEEAIKALEHYDSPFIKEQVRQFYFGTVHYDYIGLKAREALSHIERITTNGEA